MTFTKIENAPIKRSRHRLKDKWDAFMSMNTKVVKVELDSNEYSSINVARSVMTASIRRFAYPIDVMQRGDELYLVRRDM